MWREVTALWSLGSLLFAPMPSRDIWPLVPATAAESLPVVLPWTLQVAVTSDMEVQFEQCLEEMAHQIKMEFADSVVARHPIFRTPIRVGDSRVTIEKIVLKLQKKTQSYVDNGGGVRIDLEWDTQRKRWAMSGWLLWWKDSKTGESRRQYAKTLQELKSLVCGP